MVEIPRKTVLITGCSEGGLGAALARCFEQTGFHVFATVRDPGKAASLQGEHIEVLPLDVTSTETIQQGADLVRSKTGGTLDVLVNNAGSMLMGPLLDVSLDESRQVFEVNVWGMLATTQAFAPMLVQSKGVMLNICSIAGAVRMAWQGIYNSSKAAETWLSETMRIEMEPLGVRVITAMVGEVETKIYHNGRSLQLPQESYYRTVQHIIADQAAGKLQKSNERADVTARNLVRDVLSGRSGFTWRGGVAGTAKLALWLLPTRLFVSNCGLAFAAGD
ncbi:putative short-chain dehydrogenase/reductase [Aspergillus clavatus NRRL 1]|uniref:Short-chain dehydrogenase/reductase, putative n=1 Tax=Aspergillus clavatus (strain ATCC 1007 / CBS 513.65 / DSM 816 / NCTC 3887 / NRRL 1 / QM 1276 / 107) TaxID=344612 RepID=A1CUU2_ASPCL|nr:short-chain dehydrogenase/reductase, putative [Aspergillus clavatus NRRL 1]EAW07079.1 short-chain dehydrogenase/reductase, putative [Aspergillus clavatus NRRL 1]